MDFGLISARIYNNSILATYYIYAQAGVTRCFAVLIMESGHYMGSRIQELKYI
jgi:hypothetical protein